LTNFVLDENIILLAAKSEDVNGNRDYTCLWVINDITHRKCDIINCSHELIKKYQKKLNNLERIDKSAKFLTTLMDHIQHSKKIKMKYCLPKLSDEEDIHSDDIFIVRLAVATKSTLITTDCRLREKLIFIYLRFQDRHGIQIKLPSEFCSESG
jgi:ribosomal protein L14E/L6E/L27E